MALGTDARSLDARNLARRQSTYSYATPALPRTSCLQLEHEDFLDLDASVGGVESFSPHRDVAFHLGDESKAVALRGAANHRRVVDHLPANERIAYLKAGVSPRDHNPMKQPEDLY